MTIKQVHIKNCIVYVDTEIKSFYCLSSFTLRLSRNALIVCRLVLGLVDLSLYYFLFRFNLFYRLK